MSWPPRSPDLTPMDFLWNHTETLIYASPVDSEEDRNVCIEAAGTIRQQPDIFECMSVSAALLYAVY